MADEQGWEIPRNPDGNEEHITRKVISEIASKQIEALGYKELLDSTKKEWRLGGYQFDLGILPKKLKRIPDPDEARKLLVAALFGVPAEESPDRITLVQYSVAEESNIIVQTEINPTGDSKRLAGFEPNGAETKLLAGKIAKESGFLKEGQIPLDVIRILSRGATFEAVHRENSNLKIRITPPKTVPEIAKSAHDWAYKVEIYIPK